MLPYYLAYRYPELNKIDNVNISFTEKSVGLLNEFDNHWTKLKPPRPPSKMTGLTTLSRESVLTGRLAGC